MTKPKPNAKRGRRWPQKPPSPPKVSRGKGRPRVPLCSHPDRYAIGCFDALVEMFDGERRGASVMIGLERLDGPIISNSLQYPLPASIVEDFNRVADRLRKMAHWHVKPADMEWRKAISKAIGFAIAAACAGKEWRMRRPLIGRVIISLAEGVGEAAWARRVLLPLMEREPSPSLAERDERLARFLREPPLNEGGDREERLLRMLVDFWLLKQPDVGEEPPSGPDTGQEKILSE